jgi:hypothetical protein
LVDKWLEAKGAGPVEDDEAVNEPPDVDVGGSDDRAHRSNLPVPSSTARANAGRPMKASQAPGAIQHSAPREFTTGLKLAQNSVVAAGCTLSFWPVVLFCMTGIGGLPAVLAALLVSVFWSVTVVDRLALWHNAQLRAISHDALQRQRPELVSRTLGFVGLTTSHYLHGPAWYLDTHEDVGMLCATGTHLIYHGDRFQLSLPRAQVQAIEFRPDVQYSWMGLDWIRVTYNGPEGADYLYIQSRERDRLSMLPRANKALMRRLQKWISSAA